MGGQRVRECRSEWEAWIRWRCSLIPFQRRRRADAGNVNGSLNVGLSREEVVETFIQCVPYVGFPKVLNAGAVAREVFAERDALAS